MEEQNNPIIDEDDIRETRKNKIIILVTIILGTILIIKLKEFAIWFLIILSPIIFLGFFIALIVILMRFSDPIESLASNEIKKLNMSNPNVNYNKTNVRVVNKKGINKLKTLGILFLMYIILWGIAFIISAISRL